MEIENRKEKDVRPPSWLGKYRILQSTCTAFTNRVKAACDTILNRPSVERYHYPHKVYMHPDSPSQKISDREREKALIRKLVEAYPYYRRKRKQLLTVGAHTR